MDTGMSREEGVEEEEEEGMEADYEGVLHTHVSTSDHMISHVTFL